MKEETTINDLARMMADGFSAVQESFTAFQVHVDERFDALEGRVDTLEKEVRTINQRIDTVVIPVIDDHSRRIKNLELAVN